MNILQINLIIHLQSRGLNYSGQQFGREKRYRVCHYAAFAISSVAMHSFNVKERQTW